MAPMTIWSAGNWTAGPNYELALVMKLGRLIRHQPMSLVEKVQGDWSADLPSCGSSENA
mgnify:CR=1 FL=1